MPHKLISEKKNSSTRGGRSMSMDRRRRAAIVAGAVLVVSAAAGVVSATSASAQPNVTITQSATVAIGTSRAIAAVWGDSGPYKVNFSCGISGCANYVTNSTASTDLVRTVYYGTCGAGFTATHSIKVWNDAGAGTPLNASSYTRWTGPSCKQPARATK